MNSEPELPNAEDDSDPDTMTSPAGQVSEVEEMVDDAGGEVAPDDA